MFTSARNTLEKLRRSSQHFCKPREGKEGSGFEPALCKPGEGRKRSGFEAALFANPGRAE